MVVTLILGVLAALIATVQLLGMLSAFTDTAVGGTGPSTADFVILGIYLLTTAVCFGLFSIGRRLDVLVRKANGKAEPVSQIEHGA